MNTNIRPREAEEIINALEGGIVPRRGIQHLLVGRKKEVEEIISTLDYVSEGNSDIRFWIGDFGSGKSFMLRTIESLGMQKNFVVSTLDLTPSRRFYATDGKARELYSEIVDNIAVRTAKNGNGISVIIEQWINNLMEEVSKRKDISMIDLLKKENWNIMNKEILNTIISFRSAGMSYEIGQAISKYFEGVATDNMVLKLKATRWIRGDIDTKTEAKRELGIGKIIDDDNWFDAIKNLAELFLDIGYSGFIINFDEAVNLYKLPMSRTRERNYERVLNIFNECKSNKARGLFVNFGATRNTVFDEVRGMSSYGALKGRLGYESSIDTELVNTNRTALGLKPLTVEEIYTLLENLREIYDVNYDIKIEIEGRHIKNYMEEQLNRPGADEFLTPRAVIKDFLEILNLLRQNPRKTADDILKIKYGENILPFTKDEDDKDDEIQVI